ncbi:MAG: hypothetical protein IPK16_09290 [Anaerolineales bacterium]|nr:hypothetical protein [Anaerolineales bacterium]
MQSAMLEAHIQFELRRFDEAQLRTTLERELGFWVARFLELRVDELLPPARLLGWLERYMVETPITGGLADFVTESVVAAVELLQDEHTALSTLVKRKRLDEAVELAAELARCATHWSTGLYRVRSIRS